MNEFVALAIMESFTEPSTPSKIETIKNEFGLWTVKFYAHLQDFNNRNRNGRRYMSEAMIPALNTPELRELMSAKRWFGELDHPVGKDVDVARIANIFQKNASHAILDIDVSSYGVDGWIETRPLGRGQEFAADILWGSEPSFSLRALASVEKRGGEQIISRPPRIITYDAVILPSHKIAYRDKSKPIYFGNGQICRESVDYFEDKTNTSNYDRDFTNDASMEIVNEALSDFIKLESTNIKMISSQQEVSLESVNVTKDGKSAIIRDNDTTYIVKIEDKIRQSIINDLANI